MGKRDIVFFGIFAAAVHVYAEQDLICHDSPNCVASRDSREAFNIEPFSYSGQLQEAMKSLVYAIRQDGGEIILLNERQIEAIYISSVFQFKDEVSIVADEASNQLHVRSQSRTGYYDFGVNRKRIERLRTRLNEYHDR